MMATKGAPAAQRDRIETLAEEARQGVAMLEAAAAEGDPVKRILLLGAAQRFAGRVQRGSLKLKREC